MTIQWTKATRKKLHGFRHAHKSDPADQTFTLENAWALLKTRADAYVAGENAHVEIASSVREEFRAATPPSSLDPVRELYRFALACPDLHKINPIKWEDWTMVRAMLSFWGEIEGVGFILDVLARSPLFEGSGMFRDYEPMVRHTCAGCGKSWQGARGECCDEVSQSVDEPLGPWPNYATMNIVWGALRARASASSRADFQALADAAGPYIEGSPRDTPGRNRWHWRSGLIFALSRELDITSEAIGRMRAKSTGWNGMVLVLPALCDAAAVQDFAGDHRNSYGGPDYHFSLSSFSFDMLEAFGIEIGPFLKDNFERGKVHSSLQYLKEERAALKLLEKA